MRTNVYIDGFNLYYGCLKGTDHRWLDLRALCRQMLPGNEIGRIRYFTARISARTATDLGPAHQDVYLRALTSIPRLEIHLGTFLTTITRMPLAPPLPPSGTATVRVVKTEEKGSDVNLATHLLADAFRGDCEQSVVVTNDSDLAEPMRLVREELGLAVGLINPHPRQASRALIRTRPTFVKSIRPGVLPGCQFPGTVEVPGTGGVVQRYTKPPGW